MTKVFTLIFFLFFSYLSFSQQEDEQNYNRGKRAAIQIQRLKEGALFVRLFDKSMQIELIERRNKPETVKAYKAKVKKENLEIINAFVTEFDFCPVYFFYSKNSNEIRNRDFENMSFINNLGEPDSTIKPNVDFFYTADITESRIDTFFYYQNVVTENNEHITTKSNLSKSSSFEALVFHSDKLIDLKKPFPYHTKTLSSLPIFSRSYKSVVDRANHKLNLFYSRFENIKIKKKK